MASRWYVKQGQSEQGPLKTVELRQLAAEGRIGGESLVRRGDEGDWVEASHVMGLIPSGNSARIDPSHAGDATRNESARAPDDFIMSGTVKAEEVQSGPVNPSSPSRQVSAQADAPTSSKTGKSRARRRSAERDDGAPLRFPVAVVLAVVLVLTASFGMAGVALYIWRAGAETVTTDAAGEAGSAAADSSAESQRPIDRDRVADSPVARDDALLEAIGPNWHDPAKWRVGPQHTASFEITAAMLLTSSELEQLVQSPHVVNRPGVNRPGTGAAAESLLSSSAGESSPSPSSASPLSASPLSTGHASLGGVDPAADRKLLVLELKVSNRSPQDSLHYAGLNGFVDERAAALLVDNLGQRYLPLPAADGAAPRRVAEFDIAPGHSLTDVLIFTAPDESFEFVKLALPNVSIGRSGAVGFLIRRETIGQAEALPE